MKEIKDEYKDVHKEKIGCMKNYIYKIYLKDNKGFQERAFPISKNKLKIFKTIEQDVIEDTDHSEYGSSCLLDRNKGGSCRIVGYCITVNEMIVPDKHMTPNLRNCLLNFEGCTWFSKFDLRKAYFQVPISEDSSHITTIVTPIDSFRYKRYPVGLKTGCNVLARTMNKGVRRFRRSRS